MDKRILNLFVGKKVEIETAFGFILQGVLHYYQLDNLFYLDLGYDYKLLNSYDIWGIKEL